MESDSLNGNVYFSQSTGAYLTSASTIKCGPSCLNCLRVGVCCVTLARSPDLAWSGSLRACAASVPAPTTRSLLPPGTLPLVPHSYVRTMIGWLVSVVCRYYRVTCGVTAHILHHGSSTVRAALSIILSSPSLPTCSRSLGSLLAGHLGLQSSATNYQELQFGWRSDNAAYCGFWNADLSVPNSQCSVSSVPFLLFLLVPTLPLQATRLLLLLRRAALSGTIVL